MSTDFKTRLLAFFGAMTFAIPLIASSSPKGTNSKGPTETTSVVESEPTKRGPERTIEIYSPAKELLATFPIYQDYKTGILYTPSWDIIDDIDKYCDGIEEGYREKFGDIIIRKCYMPQTDEKTNDGTSVLTFETDLGTITAETTYFSNSEDVTSLWLDTKGEPVSTCNSYPMVIEVKRRLPDGRTIIVVIIGEEIVETRIIPASQIEVEPNNKGPQLTKKQ